MVNTVPPSILLPSVHLLVWARQRVHAYRQSPRRQRLDLQVDTEKFHRRDHVYTHVLLNPLSGIEMGLQL